MNSAEIKIELFRKIDRLNDKKLLKAYLLLNNFLESFGNRKTESNELDAKIELAIEEIKRGNYKSNSEVMTSAKKKFGIS